jgi:hypothetical protein
MPNVWKSGTLRLLEVSKTTGHGCQTGMNRALREWLKEKEQEKAPRARTT